MKNKVCVITGANSGIGYESALALSKMGADLAIVCRSEEKGQGAVEKLREVSQGSVRLFLADLSDLFQVKNVADEITSNYEKIDVLLNNAGGYFPSRMESSQGYEMTFALNHLNYFLLTHKLLPLLHNATQGRVVNVASRAHRTAALDFNDLQFQQRSYKAFKVYGTSKLCNILFTRQLAKELNGTSVTTNCLHPGVVRTGFGQDYQSIFAILARLAGPLFITAEKGAETSIYLSSSPEVSTVSGAYFARCQAIKPRAWAEDDEAADQLWKASLQLCADFM